MANAINYEEMLRKVKETGKSELFIRTKSHLELAGILVEHNGVFWPWGHAIRQEIFMGYAQPSDHRIQLINNELFVCLDRDGNSLFRISRNAMFENLFEDDRGK